MSATATEFTLIQRWFDKQVADRADVRVGIGDDAAITRVPDGYDLVTATDSLIAGTHFLVDEAPESIGHRSLAINLSDLAAMGAEPRWASLALHLPEADEAWLGRFAAGFFKLADRYDVALIGGDTVAGPLAVTVTLQGLLPTDQGVLRSGARPGDLIYVTGQPGSAAFARIHRDAGLAERYSFPEPRIDVGQELRDIATAMIDISDGLDSDLSHLLHASHAGAELDIAGLPVADALKLQLSVTEAASLALCGGEDYELCFCVPPSSEADLLRRSRAWPVAVTRIGSVAATTGLRWLLNNEVFVPSANTFRHFE